MLPASEWVDRFLGSDPGLTRLLAAAQAVVTTGVAMLAEWLFVGLTHAMQINTPAARLPPAQAAALAAQHHGVLVVAILLGAIMGVVAAFSAPMFAAPRARLEGFVLMPVPMVAGLALGLALQPFRVLALASFVLVLGAGAYCRRFGPRGFVGGMVLFVGDFFGFFVHGEVRLSGLGWLTAEITIGVLAAIGAQFTLFFPSRPAALRRMRRSFGVRAREVARAALDLAALDLTGSPARFSRASRRLHERLHRRLVRLNETALMIEAQLGQPGSLPPGWSAAALHRRLFDAELALTNMSRFAELLARVPLPGDQAELVRRALAAVTEQDPLRAEPAGHELLRLLREQEPGRDIHVMTHRFAISVLGFTEAVRGWHEATLADSPGRNGPDAAGPDAAGPDAAEPFAPAVTLLAGWLPGSAVVSAAASLETGPSARSRQRAWDPRSWNRIRLAPYTRVAIQVTIAATAAVLLGDMLSGRRFYWAVLAAFVTFIGANNVGEQLRKGLLRVAGTVIGVLLGAAGAHLVGSRTGIAIAVILVALFFGLYLMRVSYVFMVIAITITVSQLYTQLGQFSDSLLVLRVEETAVGAAVAALTVLCVVPLHTRRVTRVAARQYAQAMTGVVEQGSRRLTGQGGHVELRAALRRLDGSYQTLVSTMIPLSIPCAAHAGQRERLLRSATAARHYAHHLLADTGTVLELSQQARADLYQANRRLTTSLNELVAHLQNAAPAPRGYARAAALFDQVATCLDNGEYLAAPQLALRDLQQLDGEMAIVAQTLGLAVIVSLEHGGPYSTAVLTAPRRG